MMSFGCVDPYSEKDYGDLIGYLRGHSDGNPDNLFFGSKNFYEIRDNGLLLPNWSMVRLDNSIVPDFCYFVNNDFLLESRGSGDFNMSAIGGEKGVYNPNKLLDEKLWSISGINLEKLYENEL
jgi:hypothetical protein